VREKRFRVNSPNESLIVLDASFLKKVEILLFEAPFPVMFFLVFDVFTNHFDMFRTYGEDTVTILPCEKCIPNFSMHPY
jgi:hypothetical protein